MDPTNDFSSFSVALVVNARLFHLLPEGPVLVGLGA
jgi:hypothetical protein